MKHIEGSNLYLADDGMTFRSKITGTPVGAGVDLGVGDTIDNYEEIELTEESDPESFHALEEEKEMETRWRTRHTNMSADTPSNAGEQPDL